MLQHLHDPAFLEAVLFPRVYLQYGRPPHAINSRSACANLAESTVDSVLKVYGAMAGEWKVQKSVLIL